MSFILASTIEEQRTKILYRACFLCYIRAQIAGIIAGISPQKYASLYTELRIFGFSTLWHGQYYSCCFVVITLHGTVVDYM